MPKLINLSFIAILLLSSLVSCRTNQLIVQTKYFSHEDLASFYVDTPDPLQNNPPFGQKLLIFWNLNTDCYISQDVTIIYTIRFRNREEIQESFKVTKSRGYYTYALFNDDYFKSRGILTYKVDLMVDGVVIEEWRQHLWKELIQF